MYIFFTEVGCRRSLCAFYFHVVILTKIAVLRVAADRAAGGGPVTGQMIRVESHFHSFSKNQSDFYVYRFLFLDEEKSRGR